MKPKTCKVCKEKFTPERFAQTCCTWICGLSYADKLREKKEARQRVVDRRETKVKLQALKTLSELKKDVEREFNKYIRERDKQLPCISCNRFHQGQYHAGHYRSVGSSPHLRFNEKNCHKQCSVCNNHLSGNQINYRISLINKIGIEAVEAIENDNTPKHYTREDLIELKKFYRNKWKELEHE